MEELIKGRSEITDLYFATAIISVVTNLGKNHQEMLKPFLERLENSTFKGIIPQITY